MGLVLSLLLFPLRASVAEPVSDVTGTTSRSDALNGFVLDGALVPPEKIVRGMERDGVRSVDEPRFSDLEAAQRWVAPDTVILGLSVKGDSRAYPEHLLDFHQVINDEVGGVPIVVFWDPIAGLPMAFERKIDDRILIFGVAGLIYQSHCLLYDGETKSVWFPQKGQAIAGPLAGQKLKRISLRKEPLGAWVREHPDTRVLDRPFLTKIDYRHSPFSTHWVSEKLPYPVDHTDSRFHPKDLVLGVEYPGGSKAYLGSLLTEAGGRVVDQIKGQTVRIAYDSDTASFQSEVPSSFGSYESYWFAWKTLHPDTEVWEGLQPLRQPKGAE